MLTVVALLLGASASPARANEERSVDVGASHARFTVQHVLVERVTGNVPIAAATVEVAPDGETPTAVVATLDACHVNTGVGFRDGHLQGPDWFDTKVYPTWTFRSTAIATAKPGTYSIFGLFTMHGVTAPITLTTTLVRGGAHPLYHATSTVDRHVFGMTVTRIDMFVENTVTITLDVALR